MNNNEQWFLNGLVDFSDLKSKNQEWGSVRSKNDRSSNFDLQIQSNDKLLKNFKELKDKLKESKKQNQYLKSKIQQKDNDINRIKSIQKDIIKKMHQTNKENSQLKQQNQQYRQKLMYAKQSISYKRSLQEQLQLLKLTLFQQKNHIQKLQEQRKTILQISITQKLQLQQKIKKMQSKLKSDKNYIQDLQCQVSKTKQKMLQLQTQFKKIEIKYDQQIYNKKWLNNKFQKQQFQNINKDLQKQLKQLTIKHCKEKQKRGILEKRVLELQEISGLWTVKAQTYQMQTKNINKKYKKMQKKANQAITKAQQASADSIMWQQKFLKSVSICQQLISRVKRQLLGDIVSLAKSCEYKIIKLKQQQRQKININNLKHTIKKSPSVSKQSQNKLRSKSNISPITPTRQLYHNLISDSQKYQKIQQNNQQFNHILTEIKQKNYQHQRHTISNTKQNYQNKFCYQDRQNTALKSSSTNIQLKIRKQREQMQRKIRQKILYRKIQMSSSPQKQHLRCEYLRMTDS